MKLKKILLLVVTSLVLFFTISATDKSYAPIDDSPEKKGIPQEYEEFISTYLGGSNSDGGWPGPVIKTDHNDNVYVAGITNSTDFPVTSGAYQKKNNGNNDIFITKFDKDLRKILASTYFGGVGEENHVSFDIDNNGDIILVGVTSSQDFPMTDESLVGNYNGGKYDAFVAKLSNDLSELKASTYLGGKEDDRAISLSLKNENSIFIAGTTSSRDFPVTSGAFDQDHNGGARFQSDIFLTKLDRDLKSIQASTYLGGIKDEGNDGSCFIDIDNNNNVYITGNTNSRDFPITDSAYEKNINGEADIFVSRFNSDLSNLISSTFLGGSAMDMPWDISIDLEGNVFICAHITSTDYPVTVGSYDQSPNGGPDAAISKFDSKLKTLISSTFLGGSKNDCIYSLAIDGKGNIYAAGFTESTDFPSELNEKFNSDFGGYDLFTILFDNSLNKLNRSLSQGGNGIEFNGSVTVSKNGNVYIACGSGSNDISISEGAYNNKYNGGDFDVFITKIKSK